MVYIICIDRCVVVATLAENIGDRLRYMSVDAVGRVALYCHCLHK